MIFAVFSLKKKVFISLILIAIFICGTSATYFSVKTSNSPKSSYTIVIDAGHGGRDGGSVGKNGTIEKEINLKYAKALEKKLTTLGYNVVLTRKNDDGLYDENAKNKKLSDMQARLKIIEKANPALVVSIHMNSFPNQTAHGANTYYREGDDASKTCANLIQRSLNNYCNAPSVEGKPGDYYMVKCSYYTSVLVECGFISNPEEELLLNSADYQEKIIYAIFSGIQLYFGQLKNNT